MRFDGKLTFALADQAVVSSGNVFIAVLIGREFGTQGLGVYTLLFTGMIFANSVIDSTLSSSFLTRRSDLVSSVLRSYSTANVLSAAVVSLLLAIALWAGASMVSGGWGGPTVGAGPVLIPAVFAFLFREHMRRYALAHLRMRSAFLFDCAAYALQSAAVFAMFWLPMAGLPWVFVCITVAHGAAAGMMTVRFRGDFSRISLPFRRVAADVFHLSRWVLLAHVLFIIGLQMMPWLVAERLGSAPAGQYGAAMTLANVANPMLMGFINALMPVGAQSYKFGPSNVRASVLRHFPALTVATGLVCLLNAVFARTLLSTVFGHSYAHEAALVQLLTCSFFIRALEVCPYVGCWAMRRPDQNAIVNAVALVLGSMFALALMPAFGALGAGVGLLLANLITVALRWHCFLDITRSIPGAAGGRKAPIAIISADAEAPS